MKVVIKFTQVNTEKNTIVQSWERTEDRLPTIEKIITAAEMVARITESLACYANTKVYYRIVDAEE